MLAEITFDNATAVALLLGILGCIGTVIGCTYKLAAGNGRLVEALKGVTHSFNAHVLESDTRDQENRAAHTRMNSSIDACTFGLKSVDRRINEVVLKRMDDHEKRLEADEVQTRNLQIKVTRLEAMSGTGS